MRVSPSYFHLFIALTFAACGGSQQPETPNALTQETEGNKLVSDLSDRPFSSVLMPGYLESYIDTAFGTRVTRVTGNPGDPIPNIGGTWGRVARHFYSKHPVWNCDQSLLLIQKNIEGGSPTWPRWIFLDGETYEPMFAKVCPGGTVANWHPQDPSLMIFMDRGRNEIGTWNVQTDEKVVIAAFPDYGIKGYGEWNPSLDGNWVVVVAEARPGGRPVAFAYDMQNRVKYPDIDLRGVDIDWVSISPLANYVVLNGRIDGGDDRTQVYDLQGRKVGPLWSKYGRPSHYDMAVDQNGDEVAVGVSKSDPEDGRLIKRRLRDGQVTVLVDVSWASHTSTRNIRRPGWAYVSYQTRAGHRKPLLDEVVAVKLDGTRIERLAHMHTQSGDYNSEAQACPSPDGKRVIWASNWEQSSLRPITALVVDVRPVPGDSSSGR